MSGGGSVVSNPPSTPLLPAGMDINHYDIDRDENNKGNDNVSWHDVQDWIWLI